MSSSQCSPKKGNATIVDDFLSITEQLTDWNKKYEALNDEQKRDLYLGILERIKEKVQTNEINQLKKLITAISLVKKIEKDQKLLKTFFDDDQSPFKNTDLVILACEHNRLEILKYLIEVKMIVLDIGTVDADKRGHTAFYYAIQSNNVELLETLLKFCNPLHDFDNVLSKDYVELKLQNVEISEMMQIFVEDKLNRCCFYRNILDANNEDGNKNAEDNSPDSIYERLNVLLIAADDFVKLNAVNGDSDISKFISRFIAQNIRVLKEQLKSSYTILPWEEMEFYLSRFPFLSIVQRKNLQGYLATFAKKLQKYFCYGSEFDDNAKVVKREIKKYMNSSMPKNRERISGFKSLYIDYELMKDEFSLKKMLRYIKLALSVEPEEMSGRMIIQRALHVIGEYVKNSPRSPHLSETIQETLIHDRMGAMIDVAPTLRDALSHSEKLYSLFLRNSIVCEKGFFTNIQSDLKNVERVFLQVFCYAELKKFEKWIEDIGKCNPNEINALNHELVEALEKSKLVDIENRQFDVLIKIEGLVTKVREIIEPTTEGKIEDVTKNNVDTLISEIERIVAAEKNKRIVSTIEYNERLRKAISMIHSMNKNPIKNKDSNLKTKFRSIKKIKRYVKSILIQLHMRFTPTRELLPKIGNITTLIADNTKEENKYPQIQALLHEIDFNIVLESRLSKSIETFEEKLDISENDSCIEDEAVKRDVDDIFSAFESDVKSEETLKKLRSSMEKQKLINKIVGKLNREFERNDHKLTQQELNLLRKELRAKKIRGKKLLEGTVDSYGELLAGKREFSKFLGSLRLKTKEESLKLIAAYKEEKQVHDDDIKSLLNKTIDKVRQDLTDKQYKNLIENLKLRVRDHEARQKLINFFDSDADLTEEQYKELLDGIDTTDAVKLKKELIKLYGLLNTASIANSLDDPYGILLKTIQDRESTAKKICNSFVNLVDALELDEDSKELLKRRIIGDRVFKTLEDCFHENLRLLTKRLGSIGTPKSKNDLILRYKSEESFQAEVEMLLFNLCNISSTIDSLSAKFMTKTSQIPLQCMEKGFLYLDGDVPFLRGESLRNYLAHGDSLIDSLIFDPAIAVICSALIFVEEGESLISLKNLVKDSKMSENLMKQVKNNVIQLKLTELPLDLHRHKESLANLQKSHYWQDYLINMLKKLKTKAKIGKAGEFDVCSIYYRHVKAVHSRIQLFDICTRGDKEQLENLVSLGGTIHARDNHKRTLLHIGAVKGHDHIVKVLLDNGLECEVVDKWGNTPLHLAAEKGHHIIVEKLLMNGAQVDPLDLTKSTPLHVAAFRGCTTVINILLNFKADTETTDVSNSRPLHCAAFAGNLDVMKLLIEEYKVDCNALNNRGYKPLHMASWGTHNNAKVVEYLIKKDDGCGNSGNFEDTPLYIAASSGNNNVFGTLFNKDYGNIKSDDKDVLLLTAASAGKEDIVRILLEHGANVNAVDHIGLTALHKAASGGHNAIVKCLLKAGAKVDLPSKSGMIPLHLAACDGNLVVVRSLIKKGKSDVNARDNNHRTPLHTAVRHNNLKVIKFLLKRKACVNSLTKDNETPLHFWISNKYCDLRVLAYLAKKKIDLNAKTNFGWTVLHYVATTGVINAARYLMDKGARVDLPDCDGRTALHAAATRGNLDIVKCLAENTNIDAVNKEKCTPLHEAIKFGHNRVVRYLLSKGAMIDAVVNDNNNVLHLAAVKSWLNVMKTLLAFKHDKTFINACNIYQATPLCLAIVEGNSDIVHILLEHGADVNGYQKPLHIAASFGFVKIVKILLKHGTCANSRGFKEISALHCAARFGHDEIVTLLLNFDADVNATESNQCTPLHHAAYAGHTKVVEVLLNRGATVNPRNSLEDTPLMLAEKRGHMDVVQLLLKMKEINNCGQCERDPKSECVEVCSELL